MPVKLSFKIENLPKLEGQSNYTRWAGAIKLALKAYKLWSIVDGTKPRPRTETEKGKEPGVLSTAEDQVKWQEQDDQAKAVIMFSVMADDLTTVTDAASAQVAWQALKDLYDRETVNTIINLFKNVTERKLADGASLQDHLTGFHNDWIRLKERSFQGNGELSKTLQAVTSSNEAKAAYLLISLPPSMDNIVDNLQAKDKVTYEDVRVKLLDPSVNRSIAGNSKTAYRVHRPSDLPKTPGTEEKECTWCKKRKMRSRGHTWNECRKLKAHNAKQKEEGGKGEKAQLVSQPETKPEEPSTYATAFQVSTPASKHKSTRWIFDT